MAPTRVLETELVLPGGLILEDGRRLSCARLRGLTGPEQEAASAVDAAAEMTLLARCIAGRDAGDLTAGQRDALIAEMERHAPRVDLELDLTCPDCCHRFLLPFDTTAFFFEELRSRSGQ